MERADGFTLLIDSLGQLVPAGKKTTVFWPAVDTDIFHPRPANRHCGRAGDSVPQGAHVVYSGQYARAPNFREVRSLYLGGPSAESTGPAARG